ncbi:MAG: elongation factor G [Lachnospiraceae bacterium]|nr:elongation factor G [Lachnospiraceae bacterium]
MNVYKTEDIRNIAILGHNGCGKTTLIEAIALTAGIITRTGKVADGNTISDYDKEEVKRQFSISTTVVPIEWEGKKINFLDTPGTLDFCGEVVEALTAADSAIIVVSAKSGVESGTIRAWDLCEKYNVPRLVFVTNVEDEHANYTGVVEQLQELYGSGVVPFIFPVKEGGKLTGAVNIVKQTGVKYGEKGKETACDIPADMADTVESTRDGLLESVAETSEELMDKYFGGEEFTDEEITDALRKSIEDCSVYPVVCGSGDLACGTASLLSICCDYMPSPARENGGFIGKDPKTDEEYKADFDPAKPVSAFVWKTVVDPFIGKYSLVKVLSGELKSDSTVYNYDANTEERVSKLYVMRGKDVIEVPELKAGDIGAIGKLSATKSFDTLSLKASPVVYPRTEMPVPYNYMRYAAVTKGEEDKISQALGRIMEEDPTIKAVNDAANHQTLVYGIGDMHLQVVKSMLEGKYKVKVDLLEPRIAFKETIRKKVDVREKYKKQSGGHGQYGDVAMTFEPSGDLETPYVFEECVVGGAVPKNYFPAVEKGLIDSVGAGPLAGYPVVGVKATLTDGSYHPVDSSEMAFKTASRQAFKKAFLQAAPVLLEPIASLRVVVPEDFTGDVMGDLNKRRGRVLGMNPVKKGVTEVLADIPVAELYGYSTILRSMTGGRGDYSYEFARYEQAPQDVQDKIVAAAERSDDDE